MKNFIKIVCVSVLAFASLTAVARPIYITNPPVVTTSTIPNDVSGYWYSLQAPGLKFSVVAGSYYASLNGVGSTCGKLLKVTASIPRTGPTNGWVYAEGITHDSTNTGVQFGTQFNLLTKQAVAGTLSIVSYDAVNNYLVVQLSTPVGGPSGTLTLSRDGYVPYVAAVVPNCQ